jgi:hypothetical protein
VILVAAHVDSGDEHYAVYVDPIHLARLLVNEKINVLLGGLVTADN